MDFPVDDQVDLRRQRRHTAASLRHPGVGETRSHLLSEMPIGRQRTQRRLDQEWGRKGLNRDIAEVPCGYTLFKALHLGYLRGVAVPALGRPVGGPDHPRTSGCGGSGKAMTVRLSRTALIIPPPRTKRRRCQLSIRAASLQGAGFGRSNPVPAYRRTGPAAGGFQLRDSLARGEPGQVLNHERRRLIRVVVTGGNQAKGASSH
jgi:hypothetical protein